MIKYLQSFALLILLIQPLYGQNNRRVLVEEFTNASCPPCAALNPAFNALLDANEQFVSPIKYQTNFPGFDPMNSGINTQVDNRRGYYGINSVPSGVAAGGDSYNVGSFPVSEITNNWNDLTPLSIEMSHEISANYDSVFVHVEVTADEALTGNLRLYVAVLEETIEFLEPPGTTDERIFYDVMRQMLPGPGGTPVGSFTAGETKVLDLAWKLDRIYDLNEIKAIAWVQDFSTKEVWQAEHTDPVGGIPGLGVKLDLSDEARNLLICEDLQAYTPTFEFVNDGNSTLEEIVMRYRAGVLPIWFDYTWTGSVAPGETGIIEMPEVAFTGSQLTYRIELISSNVGVQTNQVDGTILYRYNKLDETTELPVEADWETGSTAPSGWVLINETNGWGLANVGAFGNSNRSATIGFYNLGTGAAVDLIIPRVDLSTMVNTSLTFDHAYTYYTASGGTFRDSFQIDVSADCGATWENVFKSGGNELATAPATSAQFSPNADQWRNNQVDLSAFDGSAEVLIRLRGVSGFGNDFFIDNVNVSGLVNTNDIEGLNQLTLFPNPASSSTNLRLELETPRNLTMSIYNTLGQLVDQQRLGNVPSGEFNYTIETGSWATGQYFVVVQDENGTASIRFEKL